MDESPVPAGTERRYPARRLPYAGNTNRGVQTMPQGRRVALSQVMIGEEEIADVVAVLRSGNLREGPVCRAFEEEFAQSAGCPYALTVSSGTAALQMAYAALLQSGD